LIVSSVLIVEVVVEPMAVLEIPIMMGMGKIFEVAVDIMHLHELHP
jgi:hypothetical protein